jgi:hypothetical protein
MNAELLDQECRDGDVSDAIGLGLPEMKDAVHVRERFGDCDAGRVWIDSLSSQRCCFAPAEATVGEDVDQSAVSAGNRTRQTLDLLGIKEERLVTSDARELHPAARIAVEEAALDRGAEELTKKPMCLLNT